MHVPIAGLDDAELEKKAERIAVQGRKDAKLQKRLKDELEWVRSGAKARLFLYPRVFIRSDTPDLLAPALDRRGENH